MLPWNLCYWCTQRQELVFWTEIRTDKISPSIIHLDLSKLRMAHAQAWQTDGEMLWQKPTTGSLTVSTRRIMLVPPLKFSRILISRLIFFFLTGCKSDSMRVRKKPWVKSLADVAADRNFRKVSLSAEHPLTSLRNVQLFKYLFLSIIECGFEVFCAT